ncbi:MAG TPA: TlpA disulfide reductase family protein [Candidatus Limnocylindria bacterium]|nr:TlpA disulfide reductase family protein [Candidatus Limnocylindria bacterium]
MPRWLRLVIVAGIAALVVVLALSFRRDPRDLRTGTVGKPAAAFALQRLDGSGELKLEPGGSKIVVLNFFASWCIPCKQENPTLVRVYERYRGSDVEFIGVLYQDSPDAGLKYVRDNGVTWPTVNDDQGRVAFSYGVFGIPETYFIGPDGVIAGRHIGPIDETTLVNGIEALRAKVRK